MARRKMERILHYVMQAAGQTFAQLLVVFGIVFALAIVLWFVSQGIRRIISSRIGMVYYYIVAPGVACHETGHALGCLLTRTRILKFVPFHPSADGTLGYVSYSAPTGVIGNMALFVISTGPIWFGCAVILGLSCLMSDAVSLSDMQASFPAGASPTTYAYISAVFTTAFQMLRNAIIVWHWSSVWTAVFLYAVFCIASEITLSSSDLRSMWKGCAAIVIIMFVANLLPFVGDWLNSGVVWARPYLFIVQVVLAFVLMVDVVFLAVAFVFSWFKKKKWQ